MNPTAAVLIFPRITGRVSDEQSCQPTTTGLLSIEVSEKRKLE